MSNQSIIENFSEKLKSAGYRATVKQLANKNWGLTANGNGHPRSRQYRIELEKVDGAGFVKVARSTPENAQQQFDTVAVDDVIPLLIREGFVE